MSDHARLSPSSRYRWRLCPASVNASEPYKGGKSSPAAVDGSHSHTVLELCIKGGEIKDPSSLSGLLLHDKDGSFGVDSDRIERVRVATDYIRAKLDDHPNMLWVAEKRVDPAPLVGRDDMHGTADVQLFYDNTVELIDYKDGMNPVSAVENAQLEQYALGVLADLMQNGHFNYTEVKMTIIQPKATIKGGQAITSHSITSDELLSRLPVIVKEAAETDRPDAPFVPGEVQCHYCPARGNCQPAAAFALKQSGIEFKPNDLARRTIARDEETMTDEKLREIIEAAPMLRKMIEAAETEALNRITNGHPIEGLKVVKGNGYRKWSQSDDNIAKKLKGMGVPDAAIWTRSLVSAPTAIDKLEWTKRDGTVERLSEIQIKKLEKDFVAKTEGKLSIAPIADRRTAVEFSNLGSMFGPSESAETTPNWLN